MKIINKIKSIFSKKQKFISREIFLDLKEGDVYIDCGANIGQEIEIVADKGVEVYAFEPNPYPFKVLQERFGKYKNVHLFQQAVLDKNSKLKLYMHELSNEDQVLWSTGSSLIADKTNVKKDDFIEV